MEKKNQFSQREKEVINLLLQGMSNKQIAHSFHLSERTIEFHLSNIYLKLGVNSRSEAIIFFSKINSLIVNELADDSIRNSTVVTLEKKSDSDKKQKPGIPMRKKILFIFASVVLIFVCLYLWLITEKSGSSLASETPPITLESTTPPAQTFIQETEQQILSNKNVFTQKVDSVDVQLIVNWFYIDLERVNLELSICNFPVPEDFKPTILIDPTKIQLYTVGGEPVEIKQRTIFGGGSGGEDQPAQEETLCFDQVFDYTIENPNAELSGEQRYQLSIPVGGETIDENGRTLVIPEILFTLDIKPSISQSLTFSIQKTGEIDNKTVTFRGIEINPSSATVSLCVFDPDGEQWLPTISLLYKGNIIYASSTGLIEGSSGDPVKEMCYRSNYSYLFDLTNIDTLDQKLSVLVTRLFTVQPERLPYDLIAHVQNDLAREGIEFAYVVVSHGADIEITKKPATLSVQDAVNKIQTALKEGSEFYDTLLFDLN